jgi:hypothetical protein
MAMGPVVLCLASMLGLAGPQLGVPMGPTLATASSAGWPRPAQAPADKSGFKFEFVERSVYFRTPVAVLKGRINREGTFIPDEAAAQTPRGTMYPSVYGLAVNDRFFPRDQHKPISNDPAAEPVYEYRSGYLILGDLMRDGYFVPKAKSTIIRFADYVPSPTAIRIYNLPGEFRQIKK